VANANKLSGNEIRERFLQFFESKGHRRVRSSSLVPHGDPTLLFTNAGMNQFKDVFLGLEKRDYTRATSAQKVVRAGGKHNDLENVGFTRRHLTFFEMLGNFSFGDYFKREAIQFAWEFLTSPEWFGLPKDQLYVTIFEGAEGVPRDDDAERYWLEVGVPKERIIALGMKDNFWQMGDTGPCGPCSEVVYERVGASDTANDLPWGEDDARYIEIWNLVFMQFDRSAVIEDGKTIGYKLTPLPKPSIDTGMGLERVTTVLQDKSWIYETDLFTPLIARAAELTGVANDVANPSLRIIADHARATTFLLTDGVLPSNEGRGYVLRKIMRRAIRHGRLLGATKPFLFELVQTVRDLMGDAYPELRDSAAKSLSDVVLAEEKRFAHTIAVGLREFEHQLDSLRQTAKSADAPELPALAGRLAFQLYDTYGLPLDFIRDALHDEGISLDEAGLMRSFDKFMEEQRTRARASWKGAAKGMANPAYAKLAETFRTELDFYHATCAKDARIEAILTKDGPVAELRAGESGEVVLDRTVIYAESGGQMADTGAFFDPSGATQVAKVTGAYYPVVGLAAHKVTARETLRVGDRVTVQADAERRARIMRNHSGTHLVHAALRNILGTHVKQAGSLNAPERLRFDFSHFAPVDAEELRDIEQQINDEIRLNTLVETGIMPLDEALNSGALAFFGDKYPESNVRVVTMPDPRSPRGFYSKELCGGTHVHRIGDIGVLKLVGEESVAAGVRRIEAVTGIGALEHYQHQAEILREVAGKLNVAEDSVLVTVEKLSNTVKQLEKELGEQKRKGALNQLDDLFAHAQTIKGTRVVVGEVANVDRGGLRQLVDSLRQKLGSGVVALGMPEDGKVALIAGVTKDLTAKVHAGKLIQALAKQVGGSGGGRPDLAEAGGKDTSALKSALASVPSLLEPLL
jgi:alanyl-tRNA synthetase